MMTGLHIDNSHGQMFPCEIKWKLQHFSLLCPLNQRTFRVSSLIEGNLQFASDQGFNLGFRHFEVQHLCSVLFSFDFLCECLFLKNGKDQNCLKNTKTRALSKKTTCISIVVLMTLSVFHFDTICIPVPGHLFVLNSS